ncbi:hypothetical protein NDU88_001982 [Pleurodeles waltl]|uniref:Uncharacterized protein n=1 Tax=Pleurodeles waltl TaxID=8319 RepID=A0AAV7KRI9_PLEWA|nr:hypothetical protein NDU88_001982 [Pleurodeles waltl]
MCEGRLHAPEVIQLVMQLSAVSLSHLARHEFTLISVDRGVPGALALDQHCGWQSDHPHPLLCPSEDGIRRISFTLHSAFRLKRGAVFLSTPMSPSLCGLHPVSAQYCGTAMYRELHINDHASDGRGGGRSVLTRPAAS